MTSPCYSIYLRAHFGERTPLMTPTLDFVFVRASDKHKFEPRHEISNNVVCATSKASDQPAYMRSLIRCFASRLNIQGVLSYWPNIIKSSKAWKGAAQADLSIHLSTCHIVGNHMLWLVCIPDVSLVHNSIGWVLLSLDHLWRKLSIRWSVNSLLGNVML